MEQPSDFESVNPGLVIGKNLIGSLLFHYNKAMNKIFKIWAEYEKWDISASYTNIQALSSELWLTKHKGGLGG